MIKAEIRANGKSAIIEFPTSIEDTHSDLRSIGVLAPLSRIKISDSEDERCRVHLFSDNDVGSHLIRLFSEKDTLYTLEGGITGLDLLNIPKESEEVFRRHRPKITDEEWDNGRTAFQNTIQYGYPTWYGLM